MKALHRTSEKAYRNPFGAALRGGAVTVGIDVWDDDVQGCELRLWSEETGELLVAMQAGDGLPGASAPEGATHFSATFVPEETGVVWYSFRITASDGAVWRYGAEEGRTCGEGAFSYGEPPSFQLTVYEHLRDVAPDWYTNGVVYQVFPDRFSRDDAWRDRAQAAVDPPRLGPRRALVDDWDTPPEYARTSEGRIAQWDFYGGSLEGIRSRLDYLEALGVTCLYLNPIFEAASNHRYDTADYLRIDPMLGTMDDFRALCEDAAGRGIRIILDGVFNHTGCDSRYFNKYGNYPDKGAWQGSDSPYAPWYRVGEDGSYTSWWGVDDLPDINEDDPSYQEFICGENGVVRTWLRAGASGWRLDVADELPDSFIERIKAAALAEKPDALVIGEVWEDASHKVAYGKLRHYFQGRELDGVMNYPFRTGVLGFLTGSVKAGDLAQTLEELHENYPPEAFAASLNLLGSHDRERLLTVLGGAPDPDSVPAEERATYRLTDGQLGLAKGRLWAAALIQMCMPGVPCVYYGDEAGLQGLRDPYNRATFPWGHGDKDCATIYRNAIALRKELPVLVHGSFEPFSQGDDVFGFWRRGEGETVCVLVNGGLKDAHTVRVPMVGQQVTDVVSGRVPKVSGGACEVFLWPLGTAVLHFHDEVRLAAPVPRGMGVLAHVTSVPNDGRPGTLGAPALRFADWLANAGVRYWQILPVNPCDQWGSPYAGLSAFAGNPALVEGGVEGFGSMPAEGDADALAATREELDAFREENASWIGPYAAFCAIKELVGGDVPWWEWPEEYRTYSSALLDAPQLAKGIERCLRTQLAFQRQWDELRAHANARDLRIIGDMPMYVSADSADVWAHPQIFALDDAGHTTSQAGAPPDPLGPMGQLWGNPTFRWDVLARRGYDWWMDRLERMFGLYDYVRLDHFLGFSSYYSIPAGATALDGSWRFGPGADLFRAAERRFGKLPIIAEDLGTVTPAVRALVAQTGAPGMSVIQFQDGDVREGFSPAPGTCAFTGTHDTQTLLGWVEERFGKAGEKATKLADELSAMVLKSDCDLAVLQLQDVLGLGDEARMNVPGVAEGNWAWQATQDQLDAATDRLRTLASLR